MDKMITTPTEAKLRYTDCEFEIEVPGDFVRCAVSGAPIRLEDLKYWSAEFQEAYHSAEHAFEQAQKNGVV
jgi:hypothetical protein